MADRLELNDYVLELNDHSLITSLMGSLCVHEPAPGQALCTLRCHKSTRPASEVSEMQKQPLADFQHKACSVTSQRYDELHDTGAATVRAPIHRSSRIRLL